LLARQDAKTFDRNRPHKGSSWVVGATAALLLVGGIVPVGAPDNTTASEHATAGTAPTAGPLSGVSADGLQIYKGSLINPGGDKSPHSTPSHRGVLAGCIAGLNC
jgi:hypothetical protein